jgi:hypothetical protein
VFRLSTLTLIKETKYCLWLIIIAKIGELSQLSCCVKDFDYRYENRKVINSSLLKFSKSWLSFKPRFPPPFSVLLVGQSDF